MPKGYLIERLEKRIPMAVALQISGHTQLPGVETTFTENVSSRGARVVSVRRWRRDDRLEVTSLPGDFRTVARVAYCQPLPGQGFAIGLEFLQPTGHWVLSPSIGAGETES